MKTNKKTTQHRSTEVIWAQLRTVDKQFRSILLSFLNFWRIYYTEGYSSYFAHLYVLQNNFSARTACAHCQRKGKCGAKTSASFRNIQKKTWRYKDYTIEEMSSLILWNDPPLSTCMFRNVFWNSLLVFTQPIPVMNKDNWKEVNRERESDKTGTQRKIWHWQKIKQTRMIPF